MTVRIERYRFRPASDAFLAKDLLALCADSGHERPRKVGRNWVELASAAETANGNGRVNARKRTADTIRIAMQPPKQVAVVRDDSVLQASGRPALLQFFCAFLKVLVNRTPDEFRDRSARLLGQL